MSSKIIGFVGVESYDLIHYLNRVIACLGCNTAIIDKSDNLALSCTVPGVLQKGTVTTYQESDFYGGHSLSDVDVTKYAYVLVDFGFNLNDEDVAACDEVYVVSDYQLHNLMRLQELQLPCEQFRALLLRDRVSSKLTPDYAIHELSALQITPSNTILIEDTATDLEGKLLCQHNSVFSFKSASQSFRDFVLQVLSIDFDIKAINNACKAGLRRG